MSLCVGIDVSKEKFDACGIGEGGKKMFSVSCPMDRSGFDTLVVQLPTDKTSFLLGMESTACYHMPLFSYLTTHGYQVVISNPLLIAQYANRSLRKTKTDKRDALTIAQFLMQEKESLSVETCSPLIGELRDLARRREKLTDQVTALKSDMKRILSVTFPELEHLTGVFTKSTLRLLADFPSAHALRQANYSAIAAIVIPRSRGRKSHASVHALMTAAASSVGVTSPAKEMILKQEACLLLEVEEQIRETTKLLMSLRNERIRDDTEILCSMRGIGENTAVNFLVEMGGAIGIYKNDKKLIAAAGLDPSTYQSGKYAGRSKISKRGNRHLRRVIWLMTTRTITNNAIFRAYFFKRRTEGLPYKKAVLATAHKLIRVMYSMLTHRTCFVEGGINYS